MWNEVCSRKKILSFLKYQPVGWDHQPQAEAWAPRRDLSYTITAFLLPKSHLPELCAIPRRTWNGHKHTGGATIGKYNILFPSRCWSQLCRNPLGFWTSNVIPWTVQHGNHSWSCIVHLDQSAIAVNHDLFDEIWIHSQTIPERSEIIKDIICEGQHASCGITLFCKAL